MNITFQKLLFAVGEVNIGEYLPRLRLGKYSPIFTSPYHSNTVAFPEGNMARSVEECSYRPLINPKHSRQVF